MLIKSFSDRGGSTDEACFQDGGNELSEPDGINTVDIDICDFSFSVDEREKERKEVGVEELDSFIIYCLIADWYCLFVSYRLTRGLRNICFVW